MTSLLVTVVVVTVLLLVTSYVEAASTKQKACETCHLSISKVYNQLLSGVPLKAIEGIAQLVCLHIHAAGYCQGDATLSWQCRDICAGMIKLQGPQVIKLLMDTKFSPETLCEKIKICTSDVSSPMATMYPPPHLLLEERADNATSRNNTPGIGRFAHLSDIHIDLNYTPLMEANCGQPVCCRPRDGKAVTLKSGYWGSVMCDAPIYLLTEAVSQVSQVSDPPEFMIFTGDGPAHDDWVQTEAANVHTLEQIMNSLKTKFPNETTPAFFTLGNHAAAPVNQFGGPGVDSWLLDPVGDMMSSWIPSSAVSTFKYAGYYTTRINEHIRLIAINTNYFNNGDFYLLLNGTDIGGQLHWLEDVLMQSRILKERVWIAGHMPTTAGSSSAMTGPYIKDLWVLLNAYKDVITATFFGHTHNDEIRLIGDPSEDMTWTPSIVEYVAASITPIEEGVSTFRIYDYDRVTGEILDAHVYRTTVANYPTKDTIPVYELAYSAKAEYGLSDLSAKSWREFFKRAIVDESLYEKFMTNVYYGIPDASIPNFPSRVETMCGFMTATDIEAKLCVKELSTTLKL